MDEVDAMITFGAVDHWTLPPDRRRRDDFERPRPGDGMGDPDCRVRRTFSERNSA